MIRAPVATYRIQLSRSFTLQQLQSLTPYLAALGVSDVYCSSLLTARAGSTHGYDICNHGELNPELGTRDHLRDLVAALRERGMGLIVDFVPNHMGIDPKTNAWWRDVLETGEASPYGRFFDIDWMPVKSELRGKVLLPILGDQYGQVLERGELQLSFEDGALILNYFDRALPINPRHGPLVFGHGIEALETRLGAQHADVRELRSILESLTSLPAVTDGGEDAIAERQRAKQGLQKQLATLARKSGAMKTHIETAIREFNGQPGAAGSFDRLHALLEVQAYRLAYWRTAFDEINYRRFFDINDLAGLRMEDPRVFAATHELLLDLIDEGLVTGIRIDHPDGLFDPASYFESLKAAITDRQRGTDQPEVYVVVEKILARGERLRDTWQVHGTTGYGPLNTLNGVFVHPEGLAVLRRVYRRFTGFRDLPADTMYASKRFMMRAAMASELNVLARALNRISESDRRCRDFTLNGLRRALTEVTACFPVYRTYVTTQGASAEDVATVDRAIEEAKRRNPVQEPSIFEFVRDTLLPTSRSLDVATDRTRDRNVLFAQKFQQYTAPVVAKGLEDTAFYNDVLLLSANEVGGDVRYRARPVTALHEENLHRLARWPLDMTAGSTHDTKRGEDARARINVIAELADQWRVHVMRWAAITDPVRTRLARMTAPDRNDEWMFYQTLVGAWPAEPFDAPIPTSAPREFVERMQTFMRKAIKEAKRHTGWLHENVEYEQAVAAFVQSALAGELAAPFLAAFVPFQRRLAWFGMLGSLGQLVLRLCAPGVPDIYQGTELWNLALVDPDNRRPVNFDARNRLLSQLRPLIDAAERTFTNPAGASTTSSDTVAMDLRDLLDKWPDGRIKLYILATGLWLRQRHPDLFHYGDYEALGTELDDPHLIGFTRKHEDQEVLVVVPRFLATMLRGMPRPPFGMERWRTASLRLPRRLAEAAFTNIFTGETVEPVVYRNVPWLLAGSAFQSWPVAMLWRTHQRRGS